MVSEFVGGPAHGLRLEHSRNPWIIPILSMCCIIPFVEYRRPAEVDGVMVFWAYGYCPQEGVSVPCRDCVDHYAAILSGVLERRYRRALRTA